MVSAEIDVEEIEEIDIDQSVMPDEEPGPKGQLALQTLAMPKDTNSNGDIFGGWLMSQMDLAGAIIAREISGGRVTTVSVGAMSFQRPVPVGSTVSCFCSVIDVGRASIHVLIDVWIRPFNKKDLKKVTQAEFVYVAINNFGKTRAIPKGQRQGLN